MNLENYLGRQWEPQGFNCWGLLREFYVRELGVALPVIGLDATYAARVGHEFLNNSARSLFKKITQPLPCCVVTMRHGFSEYESHCGVFIELNGRACVLHNWRGCGVICEPIERLSWHNLTVTGFYQYHA